MGPFELMDMIGHDVNFAVTNSVWRAFYNDQRFLPSLIQQELVDAGFFGKKTGRGFYDYREGAVKPEAQTEAAQTPAGKIVLTASRPQQKPSPTACSIAACPSPAPRTVMAGLPKSAAP
jgi:3-hydroxyacyl-CoA dehydrogenase